MRPSLIAAALLVFGAACNDQTGPSPGDWLGFEAAVPLAIGGPDPVSIAAADINGDTHYDILTLDTALGGVRIATGSASGTFTAIGSITIGTGATDLRAADVVTRDQIADLLVISGDELRVSPGSLGGPGVAVPDTLAGVVGTLALGDLDGDNLVDVSVVHHFTGNLGMTLFAMRVSDGKLVETVGYQSTTAGNAIAACVGDVTGEGSADVVIATSTAAAPIVIFPNTGGVTFGTPIIVGAGVLTGSLTARLACADFDDDGNMDVVLLEAGTQARLVLLAGVTAGLSIVDNIFIGSASDLAATDANGDGSADLAIVRPAANGVDLLLNDGTGSLGEATTYPTGVGPRLIAIVDIDRDNDLDILVTLTGSSLAVLKNNGRLAP